MSSSLNVSLSDALRAFVDENSGDGKLVATPGEIVRNVLREKMERIEAERIRDAVLDGYNDALRGRTVTYEGDFQRLLKTVPG